MPPPHSSLSKPAHCTWSRLPSSSWLAIEFTSEALAERSVEAAVDAPDDMIRM
uniref:Uncharacterized protein n=1 Tax=Arundo donax TaxID=35708 RepID=A0A0A8XN02_ARUDO